MKKKASHGGRWKGDEKEEVIERDDKEEEEEGTRLSERR